MVTVNQQPWDQKVWKLNIEWLHQKIQCLVRGRMTKCLEGKQCISKNHWLCNQWFYVSNSSLCLHLASMVNPFFVFQILAWLSKKGHKWPWTMYQDSIPTIRKPFLNHPIILCNFWFFSRAEIRNIEVPEREFSRSSQSVSPVRPVTAPARARRNVRPRSPSHPNYKEEAYLQSTVVLRYVGHTDHYTRLESRARHRAHRKSQRLPPLPAHVDEVTIEQQPRGSYVLEVFHGYLAVGGNLKCWKMKFLIDFQLFQMNSGSPREDAMGTPSVWLFTLTANVTSAYLLAVKPNELWGRG